MFLKVRAGMATGAAVLASMGGLSRGGAGGRGVARAPDLTLDMVLDHFI